MPLYEYRCESCGERFELIQKFSDPSPEACTKCGKGPVLRLFSSPAIQFKGTGWYITDYSRKGKPAAEPGSSSDAKPAEGSAGDSGARSDSSASGEKSTPATKPAGGGSGTAAADTRPAGTASKS